MNVRIKYSLFVIVFLITLSLTGCIDGYSIRKKYYMASIKPYNIPSTLQIGDSIKIIFGDSIPFRYSKNKIGNEKGELLILRNKFNKLEFHPLGEWTDFNHDGKISGKVTYDPYKGYIREIGWNYYADTASILCDNNRIISNDSLIEVQRWFYPNGNLKSEQKYFVQRGFNKKDQSRERRIKIGKWVSYKELGDVAKVKYYKSSRNK